MTNDVCSELSSVPVKLIVTVCPANEETLTDFWLYPEALLRLEYVASVVEPAFTVSLSYWTEVVVSAESTCSQKVSVAAHPAGIVTDWLIASVCVVPYPSRYALFTPEWAGSPYEDQLPIEPVVPVHDAVPDSKPGLPSFWPGDEQPPPPPEMVKVNVVDPEPLAPVAVAVTLYVPAVVGVPETVPVDEPMVMPGGRPVADQV